MFQQQVGINTVSSTTADKAQVTTLAGLFFRVCFTGVNLAMCFSTNQSVQSTRLPLATSKAASRSAVRLKQRSSVSKVFSRPPASIKRQAGFTLIEIAIVMVIISLILTGVLKGQELIDSARVRSLQTEVTGIRTAWYSFQDRYRSIPGDFPNARTQIDSATTPGNGNGRIDGGQERASVWQQLSLAGFITGNFDGQDSTSGTANDLECSIGTCPRNPYNGYYKISFGAQAAEVAGPANEIFTGDKIPVNILAELDSKLDDGKASSGRFRVHKAYATSCTTDGEWDVTTGHVNCAGVLRE